MKAHKIRLAPNNRQATHLAKAAGVARFAYNWALAVNQEQYARYKQAPLVAVFPNQYWLRKQLNAVKREKFPWMTEVTKCAPQNAIIDLGQAFDRFVAGRTQYPRFKKKGRVRDSFTVSNDHFKVNGKVFVLAKLGGIRMREQLRFSGKIMRATISREGNHWYASIVVETTDTRARTPKPGTHVGVDLGVSAFATLSNELTYTSLSRSTKHARALKRANQRLARTVEGSRGHKKALGRLRQVHRDVAHARNDATHKLTTFLADNFDVIGIEDLNVRAMIKKSAPGKRTKRSLSRSISDANFGAVRTQLTYKTTERNTRLVVVDRFYPSSKLCSHCGDKNHALRLSTRTWTCQKCGIRHNRDVNAARNIDNEALRLLAESYPATAGRGIGSDHGRKPVMKPKPMKPEETLSSLIRRG